MIGWGAWDHKAIIVIIIKIIRLGRHSCWVLPRVALGESRTRRVAFGMSRCHVGTLADLCIQKRYCERL